MKFMFSTVYRVTQKDFYARPYTSMWAHVVARQPRVYQHVRCYKQELEYRLDICRATTGAHIEVYGRA